MRAYLASTAVAEAPKPEPEPPKILVYPHLLKSRMQVAAAFNAYLLRKGWAKGTRLPRNACPDFIAACLIWSKGAWRSKKEELQKVRNWHQTWLAETRLQHPSATRGEGKASNSLRPRGALQA